jgi:flagellar hook-length control protein FliK
MIEASQSQKQAPKLGQVAAQTQNTTVQAGEEVFSLLLAMMNGEGDASDVLTSLSNVTDDLSGLDLSAIADRDARSAKIADWFAANPASLAALNALGLPGAGPVGSIAGKTIQELVGASESQELVVANDQRLAGSLGVDLVAAIQRAGDEQSTAAALMAAISANLGARKDGPAQNSSNLILARGLLGGLSLAELIAQQSDVPTNRFGAAPLDLSQAKLAATEGSLNESGSMQLAVNPLDQMVHQFATANASSTLLLEERRHTQIQQADALLAVVNADAVVRPQQPTATPQTSQMTSASALAFEGAVSWLASQQGGAATIDLTPPELGSLRLELKIDAAGESATLVVHAATDAAKAAIEQSLDRLYESFQNSGIGLQVSVGSGSSGFASGQANRFEVPVEPGLAFTRDPNEARAEVISATTSPATSASEALSLYA